MHDKIKDVIPLRVELVEIIIQREGIHAYQAGDRKNLPHHMDMAETADIGIINDEILVVEDKAVLECLAIDQKA
jgi:hypothetical protein